MLAPCVVVRRSANRYYYCDGIGSCRTGFFLAMMCVHGVLACSLHLTSIIINYSSTFVYCEPNSQVVAPSGLPAEFGGTLDEPIAKFLDDMERQVCVQPCSHRAHACL